MTNVINNVNNVILTRDEALLVRKCLERQQANYETKGERGQVVMPAALTDWDNTQRDLLLAKLARLLD